MRRALLAFVAAALLSGCASSADPYSQGMYRAPVTRGYGPMSGLNSELAAVNRTLSTLRSMSRVGRGWGF